MGKLKIIGMTIIAVALFTGSALAADFQVDIKRTGTTNGIWAVELSFEVSGFTSQTITPGPAIPGSWLTPPAEAQQIVNGKLVYSIIYVQDIASNPTDYLGDGEIFTLTHLGKVTKVYSGDIAEETTYDNLYRAPFQPLLFTAAGMTLQPYAGIAVLKNLLIP